MSADADHPIPPTRVAGVEPGHSPAYPESWAAVYDLIDMDRRPLLDFYLQLVGPQTQALLDLGCGTGSMTLQLAARMPAGARVAGVDLSPGMIAISKARAPAHEWVVGDFCDPPVAGAFDLALIMFSSLQLLLDEADLVRCFRAIAGRLKPQGRFAFDIANPSLDWLAKISPVPVVARRVTDAAGRALEVRETGGYDTTTQILESIWTLHETETGVRVIPEPLALKVKQYFSADLPRLLAAGGLQLEARYGDFDRQAFHLESKRQVCICRFA